MSTMLKRGWYVVFLPALISLPVFSLVTIVNEINIQESTRQQISKQLEYKADQISKSLHFFKEQQDQVSRPTHYDELIDALASNSRSHVSVFSLTGKLMGDNFTSGYSLAASPNELTQPEIAQALETLRGEVTRFNPIISQEMHYITTNQQTFILRIGVTTAIEHQMVVTQRWGYLPLFITLLTVISIGGYFLIKWLNNRLKIRYQQLKHRVQTQTAELLLLQEFGTLLTLSKSLGDIEQVLKKFAQMLLYHDAGVISVIRSSRNLAEIKVSWGDSQWFTQGNYTLDECWSLRKGYAHPQGPYDKLIRCTHDTDEQANVICIPLVAQGETLGVMHFKRNNAEDDYDENDRKVATSIAEQVALSIANLQLRDNLRNQAIKDSLTGLYNRRYFSETAEKELARTVKKQSMMAIIMVDLDYFKKLNDSFGHDAGDKVLQEFGSLLNKLTHNENVACRIGGEEFVVLLSDTTSEQTELFASDLLSQLRNLKIVCNGNNLGTITASIGIAMYPRGPKDIGSLVKLADQALYQAKSAGRDRLIFSQECVPQSPKAIEYTKVD